MPKMNIYACGGAATNIVSQVLKFAGKKSPGFAEINPIFLDTSSSNVNPLIPKDRTYLIEGLDGSGKLRKANYDKISECSKEMLHMFKPGDVNLVIHSASGGSGSVIGPVLVSELLSRGEIVVVALIGSTGSRIETENTLKTLHSYEVISSKRETPVIACYRENSKETPRGHVDSEIQTTIVILSALFSGENRELDGADLRNFLNYVNVTDFQPKLSVLDFFSGNIVLHKGQALISVVSLSDGEIPADIEYPIGYHASGFVPDVVKDSISVAMPIHGAVIAGYFNNIASKLEDKLKTFDDARAIVVEKSIVSADIDSTKDGLVM